MTIPAFFRNPPLVYKVWQAAQVNVVKRSESYVGSEHRFMLDGELQIIHMVHSHSAVFGSESGQLFIKFMFHVPGFGGQTARVTYSEVCTGWKRIDPPKFHTKKYKLRTLPRCKTKADADAIDHFFTILLLSLPEGA